VVVSLHPKSNPADYEPRIRAAGAVLAVQPLAEILVAADLFVAGAYSSTTRWAMAIGIPSVNLDLWDLDDATYRGVAEYPTLRSLEALTAWISGARDRVPTSCQT